MGVGRSFSCVLSNNIMLDLAKSYVPKKAPKEDKEVNRSIEQVAIWLQREEKNFFFYVFCVSLTKQVCSVVFFSRGSTPTTTRSAGEKNCEITARFIFFPLLFLLYFVFCFGLDQKSFSKQTVSAAKLSYIFRPVYCCIL